MHWASMPSVLIKGTVNPAKSKAELFGRPLVPDGGFRLSKRDEQTFALVTATLIPVIYQSQKKQQDTFVSDTR